MTLAKALQAAAGNAGAEATYIEDVFSTWLYTGNGSTQTITNGIDLSGEGGMTWIKSRSIADYGYINDTIRGANKLIATASTGAEQNVPTLNFSYLSNGFSQNNNFTSHNQSGTTYASWTFRKAEKWFDIVTWTGDSVAGRAISHSLGSAPGAVFIKCTSNARNWRVWHRSLTTAQSMVLNSTAAVGSTNILNSTTPTSTTLTLSSDPDVNNSGYTYVAYLFAHDAGGFGDDGEQNVISCGTYNIDNTTTEVNLGWEPQFVLTKASNLVENWDLWDNMRGAAQSALGSAKLRANTSDQESAVSGIRFTATGFKFGSTDPEYNAAYNYIYIAIRRGPMKTPESGTSVLGLSARSGTGVNATVTGGAGVTDLAIIKRRNNTANWVWVPRLTGTGYLSSNATTAETAAGTTILQANPWDVMDGVKVGTTSTLTNATTSGSTFINYLIKRAPGFMDVVCYTGTGVATTVAHNLAAVPELMIVKGRSTTSAWEVYHKDMPSASYFLELNYDTGFQGPYSPGPWNSLAPTASVINLAGTGWQTNNTGITYVAYLFASCPGVSKVGSYTGNGSTQTIDCGFTGGARFVLIKNTGAAESWHIFDTARGMVAGTDPRLRVNTTDSELNSNWVYTATTGFELVTSDAAVNATGNNYIFLAIA